MSMTIATPIHLLVYPLALQHVKQAHTQKKEEWELLCSHL